ncbi:B3 domain-containing protein os01g0723500 [Phtheirospermum japonicum]|uniref:B3 domain-containing protein os01g0723500 n=1 Tax=Phtheirospermum japonicum TaxID=374723 RepID=A0A830B5I5_9LAMI|nr:B3 domain-containing protein os01g0723500 [Phtheirospermum japonicum]
MIMKPKQKPSFFKVMILDFTHKLRIPPAFARDYEQSLRGENFTLRISSGETWAVKMVKTEDEKYEFTGGWNKFAKDVGLKMGEFIVFWLVGKSMFDVSIFAVTCCEREIPVLKIEDDDDDDSEVEYKNNNACDEESKAANGGASSKSGNSLGLQKSPLYFEVRLKKYQKSRLSLTMKFCEAAGLMDKATVGLEYLPKHRFQSVVLDRRPNQYRIDLTAGWPEFRKANGLVFGKTYSFEFRPRKNVIQVQEVEKTEKPSQVASHILHHI